MFKILKLLIAFVMLVDSTLVFAARAKKKNRKRNRAALSYRITRGKTNGTNIKDGDLKFKKPGEIFNKIEKDLKTPPVNSTPNLPDNKQPEPQQGNDLLDDNLPPPEAVPYLAPYNSEQQNSKAPEDPNKELKETIKELKNKLVSAKNTCGTYTTMMANINKQLGLGVSMTSGIGLGLSAIATTTGAISYKKSKLQDDNFKTHAGNQEAIKNMADNQKSLLNFDGGTGDNDDLSKITAINKTLADDKIKAFEDAKTKLANAKEKWDEADKIAKQAEDDLNNNEDQEPDDGAEPTIEIPKNLQDALTAAKNLPTEPKPTTQKNPPKKPAKDTEEEKVKALEDAATAAENVIANAEKALAELTPPQQKESEAYKKAKEAADNAKTAYDNCEKIALEKLEQARIAAAAAENFKSNPKNNPKNYSGGVNDRYATICGNASRYLAGIKKSSKSEDIAIYNYLTGKSGPVTPTIKPNDELKAVADQHEEWSTIKYYIGIGHCCKNGTNRKGYEVNLLTDKCQVVSNLSKEEVEKKWAEELAKIDKYNEMLAKSKKEADFKTKKENAEKAFAPIKEKEEQKNKKSQEEYEERKKELKGELTDKKKQAAITLREQARNKRKEFEEKKKNAALAAAEKEKQDKEAEIAKLKKAKEDAIAKAQQAINDYIEAEKTKLKQNKELAKQQLLAEKKQQKDEAIEQVEKLQQELQKKEEAILAKKELADKQQAMLKQQKKENAEFANKQTALSNSAATIQKNHKTSRNLDIATATLSAVSSVASGVSMGFSIATIEAVKNAITQLGKCKEDVRQIKLLHGKYVALTAD